MEAAVGGTVSTEELTSVTVKEVTFVWIGLTVALCTAHNKMPTDCAATISDAGHDAIIHVATILPIGVSDGPHWQPKSDRAQPAAVIAEERHDVAQGGSAPMRFCALDGIEIYSIEKRMHRRSVLKPIFNNTDIFAYAGKMVVLLMQAGKARGGRKSKRAGKL